MTSMSYAQHNLAHAYQHTCTLYFCKIQSKTNPCCSTKHVYTYSHGSILFSRIGECSVWVHARVRTLACRNKYLCNNSACSTFIDSFFLLFVPSGCIAASIDASLLFVLTVSLSASPVLFRYGSLLSSLHSTYFIQLPKIVFGTLFKYY